MKSAIRFLLIFIAIPLHAQDSSKPAVAAHELEDPSFATRTIPLWDSAAPGALGDADSDRPSLTFFFPASSDTAPTTTVIVSPAAATVTSPTITKVARSPIGSTPWASTRSLKYRLGPRYHHPIELGAPGSAIRLVRARAKNSPVAPSYRRSRFFAGGHLASTTETYFDAGNPQSADPINRASSRPDFAVLAYPVISALRRLTHQLSRKTCSAKIPILN